MLSAGSSILLSVNGESQNATKYQVTGRPGYYKLTVLNSDEDDEGFYQCAAGNALVEPARLDVYSK